jgi:hypothetical protein
MVDDAHDSVRRGSIEFYANRLDASVSMTGEADVFLPTIPRDRRVEGCLDLLHGQRTASAEL